MFRPAAILLAAAAHLVPGAAALAAEAPSPAALAAALAEEKVPSQVWWDLAAVGRPAIPHLERLLENPSHLVKTRALIALYRLGEASALDTLASLLESKQADARTEAAGALFAFLGFAVDVAAPAPQRAESLRRWNAWWKTNRKAALSQAPASRLHARILTVDRAMGVVVLTIAVRHGARKGMKLTVLRGTRPVCQLEILAVASSGSVARIVKMSERTPPQVGDLAFYAQP